MMRTPISLRDRRRSDHSITPSSFSKSTPKVAAARLLFLKLRSHCLKLCRLASKCIKETGRIKRTALILRPAYLALHTILKTLLQKKAASCFRTFIQHNNKQARLAIQTMAAQQVNLLKTALRQFSRKFCSTKYLNAALNFCVIKKKITAFEKLKNIGCDQLAKKSRFGSLSNSFLLQNRREERSTSRQGRLTYGDTTKFQQISLQRLKSKMEHCLRHYDGEQAVKILYELLCKLVIAMVEWLTSVKAKTESGELVVCVDNFSSDLMKFYHFVRAKGEFHTNLTRFYAAVSSSFKLSSDLTGVREIMLACLNTFGKLGVEKKEVSSLRDRCLDFLAMKESERVKVGPRIAAECLRLEPEGAKLAEQFRRLGSECEEDSRSARRQSVQKSRRISKALFKFWEQKSARKISEN